MLKLSLSTYLDKDPGVPGWVPGEGDHAQIPGLLLDIRNPVAKAIKTKNYQTFL